MVSLVPTGAGVRAGWILGDWRDYDRETCVDLAQLAAFLRATQPAAAALDLDADSPTRRKFLARLQGEVSKRGVIDVLLGGIKHGPHHLDLFHGTPSPGNAKAQALHAANRFSVTCQLLYSRDETQPFSCVARPSFALPPDEFTGRNRAALMAGAMLRRKFADLSLAGS